MKWSQKKGVFLVDLDTHTIVKDHKSRGEDIYHFIYAIFVQHGLIVHVKDIMQKTLE